MIKSKKAILISIQPRYVADIISGKKTLEIRKTIPKCDLPIDVYIYCSKGPGYCHHAFEDFKPKDKQAVIPLQLCNGYVVAKFTLNNVEEIMIDVNESIYYGTHSLGEPILLKESCLSYKELDGYLDTIWWNGEHHIVGYAWHIDNLVIFDRPLLLNEHFYNVPSKADVKWFKDNYIGKGVLVQSLLKAPQSWRYVEVDL